MNQDGWQQPPTPPSSPYSGAPSGGYQQPPGQNPPNNGKAIAALVLGIAGCCVLPIILSIAAIVLGVMARKEIAASNGQQGGDGMALTGLILGIVSLVIGLAWLVLVGFSLMALPQECWTDPELPQCQDPATGEVQSLPAFIGTLMGSRSAI